MSETLTLPAVIQPEQVTTGMTVRLHLKIKDVNAAGAEKERVQVFEGVVMNVGGKAPAETMTVRKVSGGIGVERIIPLAMPSLQKIELVKLVKTRRKSIAFIRDTKKRLREIKNVKLKPAKAQA
ncbi:50S ribosomal protein L19 [Patescibacteria group bacterium]|nr:50S ribosomal protein L19 [Patescibacteria group bacterium]